MTNSKPYSGQLSNPRFPASGQNRPPIKTTFKIAPLTKIGQNFQKKEPLQALCPTKSMMQIAPTPPPKTAKVKRFDSRTKSSFHSSSICPRITGQRLTHFRTLPRSVCFRSPMDRKWRKLRASDQFLLSFAKARDHGSDRFPKADSA